LNLKFNKYLKAESSSIEWEFLIHAHRAKMSLESGPGQFKDEREYKSIYSFLAATNPSDELKVEVSRALTDVLYLESEGKYVEDPFVSFWDAEFVFNSIEILAVRMPKIKLRQDI
jgi:hypothetical protein